MKQKTHPLPFNEADVFSFVVSGCDKSCDNNRRKWLEQPLFSVFNLSYESRGQGFESLPAHHKNDIQSDVVFVLYAQNTGDSNPAGSARKNNVAYCDGINALLSARCFYFVRLPASATGGGRLPHPSSAPKQHYPNFLPIGEGLGFVFYINNL